MRHKQQFKMTDETRKLLGDLKGTAFAKALSFYLEEKKEEYGNILTATSEDLKGRQFAVHFINDFLRLLNGENPKTTKNSYE